MYPPPSKPPLSFFRIHLCLCLKYLHSLFLLETNSIPYFMYLFIVEAIMLHFNTALLKLSLFLL